MHIATPTATSTTPATPSATPKDRYPSRTGTPANTSNRLDPVVHGDPSTGPLEPNQLHFYQDNGYLSLDDLFSLGEIDRYMAELQTLRADPGVSASKEAIIEPDSRELRSLFAVHTNNGVLRQLCQHPKLVAIAQQLLGGDVYIHQSRINCKSGFRGKEFYWHSDFETWHTEDGVPAMRMVSCSISLTANTPYNGPLMLIPGSHQRFVPCTDKTPDNHYQASLKRQEVGVPSDASLTELVNDFGLAAPTGLAGSVTFFECNVMHGSNSNITPLPRSNVFVVYNSVHNTPVAPFCGQAPRPNFIAERQHFMPLEPRHPL